MGGLYYGLSKFGKNLIIGPDGTVIDGLYKALENAIESKKSIPPIYVFFDDIDGTTGSVYLNVVGILVVDSSHISITYDLTGEIATVVVSQDDTISIGG